MPTENYLEKIQSANAARAKQIEAAKKIIAANKTENQNVKGSLENKPLTRSNFLKLLGLGFSASLILELLAGCTPEAVSALVSPGQSPMPEAPTSAPIEEDLTESPEEIEEIEVVPTPTEVVPQYDYTLTPEIRNFREAYVSEKELLDGTYWNWLNEVVAPTLLEEFKAREDQIRDDVPINVIGLGSGSTFFYPNEGVYIDEERTAPWNRRVTFAATSGKHSDGRTLECLVSPVFYYDKETQQIFPVVTIVPLKHPELLEKIMDAYLEEMNMPLIVYSSSPGVFEKENITMTAPLVNQSYDRLGQDEVWERTLRFAQGDYSAFSSPDMLVRGAVASGSKFFR